MIINDYKITIYPSKNAGDPLIILNTFEDEGQKVLSELLKITSSGFSLCTIGEIDWNRDMSPWKAEAIYKNEEPFGGKADEYLLLLTDKIIPEVTDKLGQKPSYTAIAGYSLAGLFSIYSLYKTDAFSKAASASGSFWFPGFVDFAKSNDFKSDVNCIYFSLGDKEANTKNPAMKSVYDNTKELNDFYQQKGIRSVFELNPGNHFRDSDKRMAKAIKHILEN